MTSLILVLHSVIHSSVINVPGSNVIYLCTGLEFVLETLGLIGSEFSAREIFRRWDSVQAGEYRRWAWRARPACFMGERILNCRHVPSRPEHPEDVLYRGGLLERSRTMAI